MENNSIIRSWNGKTIRQRPDGTLSLTDMAQACGKRVNDWMRLSSTLSYLDTLSTVTGIPATTQEKGVQALVYVVQGGIPEEQGTWGHRKPALRFAQWCSDDFAIQVDTWIEELLTTGKVNLNNVVNNQRQLPPPEERLKTLTSSMRELAELTGGQLNPTMQQHLKDFAGNLLAGTNKTTSSETKENWLGVVSFAEMELDYQVPQKGNHRRANLGAWVRCFYPQLADFSTNKDRRLVNETQQNVWVYPCHIEFVYETLSDAVHEFFCRENPNAELVNAGYFKQKAKVHDQFMEDFIDDFLKD